VTVSREALRRDRPLRYVPGAPRCEKATGCPLDTCLEHLGYDIYLEHIGVVMLLDVHQIRVWSTSV
jgi:hypothetical protein